MPDIPEEFYEDARAGEFPANYFFDHFNELDDETQEHITDAMENHNMSAEWAVMTAYHDIDSDPHSWDHVTITRDGSGDWAVVITDGGETTTLRFDNDDVAEDLIWTDLYWHLTGEGIEFDKDIDSVGTGE